MAQLTLNIAVDQETYSILCDALRIYNDLSAKDKESVADQYELLKISIAAYNSTAEKVSKDLEAASAAFTFYIRPSSTSLFYVAYLLPEKVQF